MKHLPSISLGDFWRRDFYPKSTKYQALSS